MKIQYDIDRCNDILKNLNNLIDCIDSCNQHLYNELSTIETIWDSNASFLFLQKVCENEENHIKLLVLFKEALSALTRIHSAYCDAKDLVDNKFREIQNG